MARYEQFLFFPQCFQKACFPGASKGVIVWEWVKMTLHSNTKKMYLSILAEEYHRFSMPGYVFTNHSQEHFLSFSPSFSKFNVTQLLIG